MTLSNDDARLEHCISETFSGSDDLSRARSRSSYRGQVVGFCNTGRGGKPEKAAPMFDARLEAAAKGDASDV